MMIYEACRAVHMGWPILQEFTLAGLETAIGFVEEHMRAAAFLDKHAVRKAAQEQAAIVLATVRKDFHAQRPDTIYATRTELTPKFCINTGPPAAIPPQNPSLPLQPHLH